MYATRDVTYRPEDVEPCGECRVERLAEILPRDRRPVDAEARLDRCDVGTQCGAGCIVLRVFEESCVQLIKRDVIVHHSMAVAKTAETGYIGAVSVYKLAGMSALNVITYQTYIIRETCGLMMGKDSHTET